MIVATETQTPAPEAKKRKSQVGDLRRGRSSVSNGTRDPVPDSSSGEDRASPAPPLVALNAEQAHVL